MLIREQAGVFFGRSSVHAHRSANQAQSRAIGVMSGHPGLGRYRGLINDIGFGTDSHKRIAIAITSLSTFDRDIMSRFRTGCVRLLRRGRRRSLCAPTICASSFGVSALARIRGWPSCPSAKASRPAPSCHGGPRAPPSASQRPT